jgi:hypothetical protein
MNQANITILEALNALKDNDLVTVEESNYLAELGQKGFTTWTFTDVRKVENLYHKHIQPVQRGY